MPQEPTPHKTSAQTLTIFQGGGEMGALMRDYPWENHPLGHPAQWPQSLKTNIRLLLNSEFPMFIWWSKDLYAFHNDAYLPALGKKHPKALGMAARELWAEIWSNVGGIAEGILAGGKPYYAEGLLLYLERKGFSEETYWTFSYSPAFDDDGREAGVFCACTEVTSTIVGQRRLKSLKDISDAMSQIQTLEQACQMASEVLAQNPQDVPFSQIYLLNADHTKATLFGHSGQVARPLAQEIELQGQTPTPEWPLWQVLQSKSMLLTGDQPGEPQRVPETVAGSQQQQQQQAVILPIFHPGQEQLLGFFVSGVSPKLEYDRDYQNFHELVTGQIATSIASVRARQEARRQQEELENLFEQAPVAICILQGPEHVVELANPGICALWGKKQEDVLGKPLLAALPEVKDQGIKELLDRVFLTGVPYVNSEMEVLLEHNGKLEPIFFSFVYQPMRDAKGTITGVIAVAISVNAQVEARQEIEAMNSELRAINVDLDNFVYSASHDLKAPISNIEGLVDTLVEQLPPETRQQEVIQRVLSMIQTSITRFKRAVADLTEVTKIQRENNEDVAAIDLKDVVADVQLDLENMIQSVGAKVVTAFTPASTVKFSAKNVRSIVYNLFSNALKYRSPERAPVVTIQTQAVPGFLVFSVTDNGLGIEPEARGKIFTMFKRLHDHVEGTGIGLYIVKRIVENAGGRIVVESEAGKGSTFKVYFKQEG
ncbi:PAS domain-containing sensor histidine kinase [Rufibacter quisquiliarum]|uniref:histidine kinase n=1 Tax=Rufibacter quisquiliarum TaxID=1549639 RepID=A0A839GF30_9BACT|nr:ATP-binding protein [Rufibacter quisquiliarum]MBA9078234.1 PAS domain S-box-containing protein [Rufibacter quisquiliarum]